MAFNTGNPVPSSDAKDLSDNAENFDSAVNTGADKWTDRLGVQRDTVKGRIDSMGFAAPVPYASGIVFSVNDNTKTVEEVGVVYAPLPSSLPFTTTNFGADVGKLFVVQGVTIAGGGGFFVRQFNTLDEAINSPILKVGDALNLKERTAGNGGGAVWDVYPSGSFPLGTGVTNHNSLPLQLVKRDFLELIDVNAATDLASMTLVTGQRIVCRNYTGTDGAKHERIISAGADGTNVPVAPNVYANLVVKNNELIASHLGLVAGGNYTTLFNNTLVNYIKINNITKIVLDTGDITIDGVLDFVYGSVTFSGKGQVNTADVDNMLQRVQSERTLVKQYHGAYNVGSIYNQAIKTSALVKKELRVVLFGDSISVGADYDSFSIIPVGFVNTTGVDNVDRHDCLAAQLFAELVANVPLGTRVLFYTRSIGGLSYSNIDQPWDSISGLFTDREQATAGKTWRDCVLDLNPDLVIHSMGMNHNPVNYVDNFLIKWDSYLTTERKRYTFDQVILTTPNPNFADAQQFGDFREYDLNASKFYVSHLQRYMARNKNYSLIDVGFNSYLKRYGFDPRSCTFRKDESTLTLTGGDTTRVITPGSDASNTSFTPQYQPIYHSTTFTINPSVNSDTVDFDFKMVAGSVIVQFTQGEVRLFAGIYPTSLGTLTRSTPLVLIAGTDYTFIVTVTPSGLYLYHNDELLLVEMRAAYNETLPMRFENANNGFDVTLVSGVVRGAQFARYSADTASDGEIYGVLQFQDNEFGGGINHPSTVGLSEIYLPPAREFFKDMLRGSTVEHGLIGGTNGGEAVFIGRMATLNYGRITVKEYGSGIDLEIQIRVISGVTSYVVLKNPALASLSIYLDITDMSLFLVNQSAGLFQFEYTGDWLSKRAFKLGAQPHRGTLLPDAP